MKSETSITFGCTESFKKETRVEAAKEDEGMSQFIRQAIREKIENASE